jgi:hypothetical protein
MNLLIWPSTQVSADMPDEFEMVVEIGTKKVVTVLVRAQQGDNLHTYAIDFKNRADKTTCYGRVGVKSNWNWEWTFETAAAFALRVPFVNHRGKHPFVGYYADSVATLQWVPIGDCTNPQEIMPKIKQAYLTKTDVDTLLRTTAKNDNQSSDKAQRLLDKSFSVVAALHCNRNNVGDAHYRITLKVEGDRGARDHKMVHVEVIFCEGGAARKGNEPTSLMCWRGQDVQRVNVYVSEIQEW